jgi:hypothetical protein
MDHDLRTAMDRFFRRLVEPDFIFNTDNIWPDAALEQLQGRDADFQIRFWTALEEHLKEKERTLGHIHKGDIYWFLAILFLGQGNLTKTIEHLDLSAHEDRQKGRTFSAAIGLSSILKPLVYHFRKDTLEFDQEIMGFYESLSAEEKREFAERLVATHQQVGRGGMAVLPDAGFQFVVDPTIRRVVRDSYLEMKEILAARTLTTYFSCLFSAGSILDGILDDLFAQHDQRVWRVFHSNAEIQREVENDIRLRAPDYNASLFLGRKLKALRLLAERGISPVPKVPIVQMLIIAEYRNLIHTKRRMEFAFEVNWYVAACILTFINQIASRWSPQAA